MVAKLLGGLCAAAMVFCATSARADTYAGGYGIPEHDLNHPDSWDHDQAFWDGDIQPNLGPSGAEEYDFINQHLAEGLRWTAPLRGPLIVPQIAAATSITGAHDSTSGLNGYAQTIDLDLYWLQIRLPGVAAAGTTAVAGSVADFDLLLPWTIDDHQRLGLLLGTGVGLQNGGLVGQRFQADYGIVCGIADIQLRAGYALQGLPSAAIGLPVTDGATRQSSFIYGGTAGFAWAPWGRATLEVDGAQLLDTHENFLSLLPGVRFRGMQFYNAEVGLSLLLNFHRFQDSSFDFLGAGGVAELRYTFL
ncbi:MAG: hypothetical protein JST54_31920 [Deltaproteobacteria bacterium]|nr:hypothetical protein [Deltaproteobacteria bacterium]